MKAIDKDYTHTEMLSNVRHSTESAITALQHLKQSLVKGRFQEGLMPYRAMCSTLAGQRVWSLDKNDNQINQNFDELARLSNVIINLLEPYVSCLQKLANVTEVQPVTDTPLTEDEEQQLKILEILKEEKHTTSFTRLRSSLNMERKKLESHLSVLEEKGCIAIKNVRGRKLIELATI